MERDQMLKIVIIGDSEVGKSNILSRYFRNEFGKCQSTIGCESFIKKLQVNGRKIKLMIWDTAGQERYKSISQAYYRGAGAVILVYDITNPLSFSNLNTWYDQLILNSQPQTIKIVVGNKTDLELNRKVSKDQGQIFSRQRNLGFMEVSAANGSNVNAVFQYIVDKFLQNAKNSGFDIQPSIKLSSKTAKGRKKQSGCC